MASNKVQIKFDIDSKDLDIVAGKTLTLQQQIRILKQEIQKPGYSPAELDILRKKLADTEDAFRSTKARSGDFITTLQLIPGPIGDIAAKLNGAISLFKQFGSFKLSDLKFQFKETLDDIKDVGRVIGNATGLTKLWTVSTNAMAAAMRALGIAQNTAAVASKALAAAIAATGIGLLVVGLSMAISKLMDYASNTKKAEEANDRLKASLERLNQRLDDSIQNIKDAGEIRLLQAKKEGASEQELQKIKEQNLRKEIKAIEDALSEKGTFAQQEMDIVRDVNLTKEQIEEQSLELAKARNAASRRLTTARIELQKLEIQGEIDANERRKQSAKDGEQLTAKTTKEAQELAEKLKKQRDEQIKGVQLLGEAARASVNKQVEEDRRLLESKKEFNRRVRDLYISTITDENARRKAEIRAQEKDELEAFTKDINYIQASEEEKGRIRYAIREKYRNLLKGVNDQAAKDEQEKDDQNRMEKLRILELQGSVLIEGTRAYYKNRLDIIDETEKVELQKAENAYNAGKVSLAEYEAQKTAIEQQGANSRAEIKKQELAAIGRNISASIDALANLTSAIAGSLDEEAKTSKSAFEKRKKLQIATAVMSAASGLVQILTQPSTLPSPADWIVKGINALALGIATNTNIQKIKATQFEAPETTAPQPYRVTANRAQGGIVTGPGTSTSDSIPAMLSNGEYVVNARATSSFLPLLTAINDTGRRRFAMGGLATTQGSSQMLTNSITRSLVDFAERPVKTFVVGQDMSNQQQFDRLIKSRSLM